MFFLFEIIVGEHEKVFVDAKHVGNVRFSFFLSAGTMFNNQ